MASTQFRRLILLIATVLLSIAATNVARSCKTILFISTTTTTTSFPLIENPNFQNPSHVALFFTSTQPINPNHFHSYKSDVFFTNRRSLNPPQLQDNSSSFRDSMLDVMSLVGALLFGIGSGALTAAIMYLVWSMFSPRRFEFGVDSDDEKMRMFIVPKKMGYVAIPVDNGGLDSCLLLSFVSVVHFMFSRVDELCINFDVVIVQRGLGDGKRKKEGDSGLVQTK